MKSEDKTLTEGSEHTATSLFPCTSAQARWWILDKLHAGDPSANIALLWELQGRAESSTLAQAFRVIIQRHEILRTRFVERDGEPLQEVRASAPFNLSEIDLGMLEPDARAEHADGICQREAIIPFDLSSPPLLRVTLLRFGENRARLLMVVHHSVFDGWSIGVLGRELGQVLLALGENRSPDLLPLPLQYGDYALWRAEVARQAGYDRASHYWIRQLAGFSRFEITPDRARLPFRRGAGASLTHEVAHDLAAPLEDAARSCGVSFFSFGCAIVAAMLGAETGKTDIVLGTQVAARTHGDLNALIGPFVNNLVLRLDARDDQTFSAFAQSVSDVLTGAIDHQELAFDELVRLLNHKRDLSRPPLYSINVTIQHAFMEDQDYGPFALRSLPSPSGGALYDLAFQMVKRPSGWRMTLEYDSDLFERATAARLMDKWIVAIREAGAVPHAPVGALKHALGIGSFGPRADPRSERPPAMSNERLAAALPDSAAQVGKSLIAIWREILGVQSIGPTSDFFALGGHSLPALRMLARAERELSVKLDPAAFFATPTIASLVQQIQRPRALEPWRIVRFRSDSHGQPLIALNGSMLYHELAHQLAPSHPFFSVQVFDPQNPHDVAGQTLEEVAASYVELVRAAQPNGPYALVGHCALGAYAFEAARQLQASGESVSAVVMFDAWAPGHSRNLSWARALLMRVQYGLHDHYRRIVRLTQMEISFADYICSFGSVHRLLFGPDGARRQARADPAFAWFMDKVLQARSDYTPSTYKGDVLIFRTEDCPRGALFDGYFGWREFVIGRLRVRDVGGSHAGIRSNERAAEVARHITDFLAKRAP